MPERFEWLSEIFDDNINNNNQNITLMKKKLFYTAPQARLVEIETQSIFAQSFGGAGYAGDELGEDDDYGTF